MALGDLTPADGIKAYLYSPEIHHLIQISLSEDLPSYPLSYLAMKLLSTFTFLSVVSALVSGAAVSSVGPSSTTKAPTSTTSTRATQTLGGQCGEWRNIAFAASYKPADYTRHLLLRFSLHRREGLAGTLQVPSRRCLLPHLQ